ncbi:putative soluble epoxide hydrolase [Helianthus debilis subsp. tardiflorus]
MVKLLQKVFVSQHVCYVNGINMHVAEMGEGPVVLLLHGFPELWYSWRHEILFLVAHGYRAVAHDLRGYGETTGAPPHDHSKFTALHVVGDLVALIDTMGADKVFVVGHDWGAMMGLDVVFVSTRQSQSLGQLERSLHS